MKQLTCDVLVVGAGPAGTSAAREAAGRGARVVVVERRAVIGTPVQCAEYIPKPLLGEAGIGRNFVVQSIRGMRTILNGCVLQEAIVPGYMIRRDIFDQTLAGAAEQAGAHILPEARAAFRDGCEVIIHKEGSAPFRVRAKVIIGADGPHSRVGKWIASENRNRIPAIQTRVALTAPLDLAEVYFDARFRGGYGWLFPKGDEANVGLGMKHRENTQRGLRCVLMDFLALLTRHGKIAGKPRGLRAGWIPAEKPRTIRQDNILLAGDAAGHAHPMTGAGVAQAVIGGRLAGKWAARAIDSGDMDILAGYESEWLDLFGETIEHGFQRRRLLERNWDRIEEIIKYCWVTFREYYAPYAPNQTHHGAGPGGVLE
jgi:geranylgeranyl reductase family protein